jgi:hypothetical protein
MEGTMGFRLETDEESEPAPSNNVQQSMGGTGGNIGEFPYMSNFRNSV